MRYWARAGFVVVVVTGMISPTLAFSGERLEVQALLQQARQDLPKIKHERVRGEVLVELASAIARSGDKRTAATDLLECVNIAKRVSEPSYRDSLLMEISEAQATAGDFPAGLQTLDLISPPSADRKSYNGWELCLSGLISIAVEQKDLERALSLAKLGESEARRDSNLVRLVFALSRKKDYNTAQEIIKRIKQPENQIKARQHLADAAIESGDIPLSKQILDALPESSEKSWSLRSIVLLQLKNGAPHDFEVEIGAVKKVSDETERNELRLEIVTRLAAARKFQRAAELSREIDDPTERYHAEGRLAYSQAEAGDIQEALRIAERLQFQTDYARFSVLKSFSKHRRTADQAVVKRSIPVALKTAAELCNSMKPDLIYYPEIAVIQAELGDSAAAGKTFRRAFDAASKYPEVSNVGFLFVELLVRPQARLMGPEEISKWIAESPDPEIRARGRIVIAECLLDGRK